MPSQTHATVTNSRPGSARQRLREHAWVFHLGGLSPWELTKRVLRESREDDILGRAAQLSFYFILAFFPLMIFACSLAASLATNPGQFSHSVLGYMRPLLPYAGFQLLRSTLDQILRTQHLRVLSLVFALWSASYGLEALISGLNVAFDIREFRSWWKRRLLATGMTAILASAVVLTLVLIIWGGGVGQWAANRAGEGWLFRSGWFFVRWALVIAFLFATVALLYKFAPNLKKQSLLSVLPGALIAIALWIVSSLVFRLYLGRFFASSYGQKTRKC
jgi:membrane protein